MGEFFGSMYASLFESFYGYDLADYLWGITSRDGANLYTGIGLWLMGISLAVAVVFYYVINHPKFNNWWGWLIFMGINFAVNFVMGLQWTLTDLYAGKMVVYDKVTKQAITFVTESNCLRFGVANALLAIVVFFIFSMIIKWWSKNVAHAPF